ncbi:hypothetical protein, partial [Testudinibacter sp. TR-2022]|uniref:hypothetical protein n=1 Tax=Testudinibacter sp. TR-2022 TaxID=2585029 RepID=UPI00159BE1C6
LIVILLTISGKGFEVQRSILKLAGLTQSPKDSQWYFISSENPKYLNFIREKDSNFKIIKNAEDEFYLFGYLILNTESHKVICPKLDSLKETEKFEECLSLTKNDLKPIGLNELYQNK